jgi:sensor c-di-GMP phosphodiesterase-like protein
VNAIGARPPLTGCFALAWTAGTIGNVPIVREKETGGRSMTAILEWVVTRVLVPGVLAAGGWLWVGHLENVAFDRGAAQVRSEVEAVARAAQAQNDERQRRELEKAKEAQDARDKKLVVAQADAGRMRGELDRLRDALVAGGGDVPATGTDAVCEPHTSGEFQRVLAQELERVSRQGAEMAEQCDRIVIDRDTLAQAWPR